MCYSQVPGFVTIKFWECICLGLIPFIHPDYDCNHYLNAPEYLYLKSPEDLRNKIEELENNPEMYRDLMNQCIGMFKESWLSGSALNNYIFKNISEMLGFTYEKSTGIPEDKRMIFHRFKKDVLPEINKK